MPLAAAQRLLGLGLLDFPPLVQFDDAVQLQVGAWWQAECRIAERCGSGRFRHRVDDPALERRVDPVGWRRHDLGLDLRQPDQAVAVVVLVPHQQDEGAEEQQGAEGRRRAGPPHHAEPADLGNLHQFVAFRHGIVPQPPPRSDRKYARKAAGIDS